MSREIVEKIDNLEKKFDKHINNDFVHLVKKVAFLDGKVTVILMIVVGIAIALLK